MYLGQRAKSPIGGSQAGDGGVRGGGGCIPRSQDLKNLAQDVISRSPSATTRVLQWMQICSTLTPSSDFSDGPGRMFCFGEEKVFISNSFVNKSQWVPICSICLCEKQLKRVEKGKKLRGLLAEEREIKKSLLSAANSSSGSNASALPF